MNTSRLQEHLEFLYGSPKSRRLLFEIEKLSNQYQRFEYYEPNPYWYKYMNLYIMYPDSLHGKGKNPLQRVRDHIPHIQSLGCTALHIHPFLQSPLVDKGFDISDFYSVRRDLGHLNDLREIIKICREHGIRVFMDLVFNHVSDQHEWFQRAQNGEKKYREYFLYTNKKPEYIRKFHKDAAVWAEFKIGDEIKPVNMAFPEFSGEIPLWRKGTDGYWYYHTYYPEQPDINWCNPDIFLEFTKILFYWASLGFNFRLDAIPFVGQQAYKDASGDNDNTHHVVSALRLVAQIINPECAFIVETFEKLDSVIAYFGSTNHKEAHLSYNFHLCTDTWISLVEKDNKYVWEKMTQTSPIPNHAEWINFLRNHDELSLAYVEDGILERVNKDIGSGRIPFREGHGIAGRTRSLLGGNVKRTLMAFCLLSSLPGGMGILYGDEFGVKNVPVRRLSTREKRDPRNFNRGRLSAKQMENSVGKQICDSIRTIIRKRAVLKSYINVFPVPIEERGIDKEVFAARYILGISELDIYINLSEKPKKIHLQKNDSVEILKVNQAKRTNETVELGAFGCIWLQR